MQSVTRVKTSSRSRWARLVRALPGYLFIAPAGAIIVVFSFVAIALSLYISFHRWGVLSPIHPFVGLANYQQVLFNDDVFWKAFQNTATFVIAYVPGTAIGGLMLALIGNQAKYGRSAFRAMYFIPSITPMVVIALIWLWIYTPEGLMNQVLRVIGLPAVNWLMDERAAMPAIIFMSIWGAIGYYMVLFMAGLADIPSVYFDAAQVDGASSLQTFWYVTLPLLRNTLIFVMVVLTIGAFQVFTQVYVMTRGGPANATEVVQALIYKQAFENLSMGYASAMSWCLFVAVATFAAIQMKVFRSQQLY
jgi:multiple sugar transport system permease protein